MKISKTLILDIAVLFLLMYGNYLVLDWEWSNVKSFISGGVMGGWIAARILLWRL